MLQAQKAHKSPNQSATKNIEGEQMFVCFSFVNQLLLFSRLLNTINKTVFQTAKMRNLLEFFMLFFDSTIRPLLKIKELCEARLKKPFNCWVNFTIKSLRGGIKLIVHGEP